MVYHDVTLGPTDGQLSDLASGEAVQLAHKHFDGDVPFKLTSAQVKRIQKAYAAGKGCKLKLSAAQVRHMAQKGSGRFTDILKSGYNFLKPSLRQGLSKGMDYGKNYVENKIADVAGLNQQGKGWFGNLLRGAAHGVVDIGANLLGGHANMHPVAPARRAQKGKGWMKDLGKKIAHGGIDFIADRVGGDVQPNPHANPNEALRAAMFQKKVVVGSGLKW